ncbi:MAG: DUF192 domain-containing protein [Verrucomicrobia bacterium]|nr:DUF192 domain-containing protein [Verrucomicrobiota bacterium]
MVGRDRSLPAPLLNLFSPILLILSLAVAKVHAAGEAKLHIGDHTLTAELAVSPNEQMTGLMNRDSLESNHGMLFVFPQPKQASFWMHNTSIPLDLAFLDADGVILEIIPLVPFEEKPVLSKSSNVSYALEVSRDWFASRNLKAGMKVSGIPK